MMGTGGFIGFVVDGTEKIAYNRYDSYPGGLGSDVLAWLHSADIAVVTEQARALRVVDPESNATEQDVERLRKFADPGDGSRDLRDWRVLLRKTRRNPALILEAGVIGDAGDFPLDSLFAEWGYVVDFDAMTFEVYEGFQQARHSHGRFAGRKANPDQLGKGYYPCRLIRSWPLAELPDAETFVQAVDPDEDES